MAYKKLFEPGRIGGLTIRNRAVMSPMGTDLADIRGNATPRLIAYYTERAKGGIGLIINEYTGVDDVDSIPTQHNLRMAQDYNVQEAEELTRSVHAYGAKIFAQLHHGGATSKSAFTGRQNLSPSGVPMAPGGEVPREMTLEDIKRVQEKFIAAAIRCKKAGYDGVELHGAHSYLIAQFFSKYYNRRTDAYGGSLENRCRFIDEIIAGIRAKLGRYPISVRICGDEMTDEPGFLTLEDGLELGRHLEVQGIDCINISNGSSWNGNANCEPFSYTPGWKKHVAKAFKEALSIPVIATNTIKDPDFAESLLEEGVSDFVGVSRGQMADPEWVNKARAGREDLIRKCMGCMQCNKSVVQDGYLSCAANPVTGRGTMYNDEYLIRSGAGRNVVVIGGGPAGMQAAITLAKRAFHVILLEQKSYLGGMAYLATVPPHKTMVAEFIKTLEAEMKELGVDVRMNVTADVATVKALEPYAVVVANGGTEIVPQVAGLDSAHVHTMEDTLLGKVKFSGRKVAVIGGGMVGLETAHYLCKDNQVTIVEMTATPGATMYPTVRNKLLSILKEDGVELLLNHALTAVEKDGLLMICTDSEEPKQERMAVDEVVIAVGRKPNMDLYHEMGAAFERVVQAGDCIVGGSILEATRTGNDNVWFL